MRVWGSKVTPIEMFTPHSYSTSYSPPHWPILHCLFTTHSAVCRQTDRQTTDIRIRICRLYCRIGGLKGRYGKLYQTYPPHKLTIDELAKVKSRWKFPSSWHDTFMAPNSSFLAPDLTIKRLSLLDQTTLWASVVHKTDQARPGRCDPIWSRRSV